MQFDPKKMSDSDSDEAEELGVELYGALRNADVAEVRRALGAGADPNLHAPPHGL